MVHCNLTIICAPRTFKTKMEELFFIRKKNNLCLKAISINPPFFHFLLIRWSMLHNIIHNNNFFKYRQVHHGKLNFYLHFDANYLVLQSNWLFILPFQTIRLLYFEPKCAFLCNNIVICNYITFIYWCLILAIFFNPWIAIFFHQKLDRRQESI